MLNLDILGCLIVAITGVISLAFVMEFEVYVNVKLESLNVEKKKTVHDMQEMLKKGPFLGNCGF